METTVIKPNGIDLVIAGHTNTGKTSLLRTLGRSQVFGEVSPAPSTTQLVKPMLLVSEPELTVTAYDTPGLERARRLRDQLTELDPEQRSPIEAISRLKSDPALRETFEQEILVLDLVRRTDATLYVIDAREEVLEKYLDEIWVLSRCGRPILPLLNFTGRPNTKIREWREGLSAMNHHVVPSFDAVVYDWESEKRLYRSLSSVLPEHHGVFDRLERLRAEQAEWRTDGAIRALADALIDMAACEEEAKKDDTQALRRAVDELGFYVRSRERKLLYQVLDVFNYSPDILGPLDNIDVRNVNWIRDAFDPTLIKHYGVRSIKPLSGWMGGGAAIDLATGGATLGSGFLVGTTVGLVHGARGILRRVPRKLLHGLQTVAVSPEVLTIIATRNLHMIRALEVRGHASLEKLEHSTPESWRPFPKGPPSHLLNARDNPQWSSYSAQTAGGGASSTSAREKAQRKLEQVLRKHLRHKEEGGSE